MIIHKSYTERSALPILKYARLVPWRGDGRWAIIKKAVKHWWQTEERLAAPSYKQHLTDHSHRGHILPSQRYIAMFYISFVDIFNWNKLKE